MTRNFLDGFLIFLRSVLHDASLQWPAQVQHGAVIEGLATDHDGFLHDFARDHVARPADITVDHMTLAIGRRYRATRSAEVDSQTKRFVGFFHELSAFPVECLEAVRVTASSL